MQPLEARSSRQRGAAEAEDVRQVDREHALPLLVGDLLGRVPHRDPCGRDEHVEPAEGLDGRADGGLGRARLGHVGHERERRADLLHRRIEIDRDDRTVRASRRRHRGPDAGGGAGDERDGQTRSSAARAAATTRSTSPSSCAVESTECSAGDGER